MTGSTAQYTSVFHFIEESIPKLKRIQHEDMSKLIENRAFQTKQRIFKTLIREALKNIK
jgi:hypothetical protein